jgi:hypothetical protein
MAGLRRVLLLISASMSAQHSDGEAALLAMLATPLGLLITGSGGTTTTLTQP